jgi:transposase-like protein
MLSTETIECPYCGEPIDLVIDGSVDHQRYIEDCAVCCRPIEVEVAMDASSELRVTCRTDSDS